MLIMIRSCTVIAIFLLIVSSCSTSSSTPDAHLNMVKEIITKDFTPPKDNSIIVIDRNPQQTQAITQMVDEFISTENLSIDKYILSRKPSSAESWMAIDSNIHELPPVEGNQNIYLLILSNKKNVYISNQSGRIQNTAPIEVQDILLDSYTTYASLSDKISRALVDNAVSEFFSKIRKSLEIGNGNIVYSLNINRHCDHSLELELLSSLHDGAHIVLSSWYNSSDTAFLQNNYGVNSATILARDLQPLEEAFLQHTYNLRINYVIQVRNSEIVEILPSFKPCT